MSAPRQTRPLPTGPAIDCHNERRAEIARRQAHHYALCAGTGTLESFAPSSLRTSTHQPVQ